MDPRKPEQPDFLHRNPAPAAPVEVPTLRDQFAMAALNHIMPGMLGAPSTAALWAYEQADAMMKARKPKEATDEANT
jgi:hypothetical protein